MMKTLFAFLSNLEANKLFKFFPIDVSSKFICCADRQLTYQFEQMTSLKIDNRTWVGTVEKEDFFYKKGAISKLPFLLYLPYLGRISVTICWQSKSGRIYDIADEDIDCNDIEFWFENLDVELCRKASNPTWSLIPEIYQSSVIQMLKRDGFDYSASFISCLDKQLSEQFEKMTGIKISKRIRLSFNHSTILESGLTYGKESSIKGRITIIEEYPNYVKICWRSRSGRIYKISDEDLDCNDIEFWFDNFQPEVYIRQYYPNQPLPFKISNLTYELVVNRIHLDCTIVMTLREEAMKEAEPITGKIDKFINAFNEKSDEKGREDGVIHNWNTEIRDNKIIYNLDLGSTGISFFKKLLRYLSKFNTFSKVEIE